MSYADEIGADDVVFEEAGVKVVVDRESLSSIDGTEIDFVRTGPQRGLQVPQPQRQGRMRLRRELQRLTARPGCNFLAGRALPRYTSPLRFRSAPPPAASARARVVAGRVQPVTHGRPRPPHHRIQGSVMALERTLSIVKPDGVRKNVIGDVYRRFEQAGLRIVAARMLRLTQAQAEAFYAHPPRAAVLQATSCTYMTSGPVMVQVLEGEGAVAKNRDIMGATDPKKAAPGTIRADLADSIEAERRARLRQRSRTPRAKSHSSSPKRSSARAERGALRPRRTVQTAMSETTRRTERTNLLGLTRAGLEAFVVGMGEKPFRARQLFKWIYKRAAGDFDAMTDLGKDFRRRLAEIAEIRTPEILEFAGLGRRHAQVGAQVRGRAGDRDGVHPGARPRHAVHLEPGRLRRWTASSARPARRASTAT